MNWFVQGARLETFCDGDWWESRVVAVQSDRAMIHYIGGEDDEDEWISKDSHRLRPVQKCLEHSSSVQSTSLVKLATVVSKEEETDFMSKNPTFDISSAHESRPRRQSSLSSDDARLARALQEEELRACRARNSGTTRKRPREPQAATKIDSRRSDSSATISKPPEQSHAPKGKAEDREQVKESTSTPASKPKNRSQVLQGVLKVQKAFKTNIGQNGKSNAVDERRDTGRPSKSLGGARDDKLVDGGIRISVVPDESASPDTSVPALRRSRMALGEDATVLDIKRRIVEEACPGTSAAEIDVRAPSGMLLGQDHSLKFVRTVLWPPSRGELVLRYSRKAKSLL